jgi:serine/threonine-protein kinase
MPLTPGTRLGAYEILSLLGAGGMGEVYRALDTTLGREVALKVLPADMASDPARLERFRREARALAALNHPHIVTIYSVEHAAGVHFLTMELVTGRPLDRVIAAQPMPIERVLQVAQAVSDALAAAHERGIVHRDLKPANVIVSDGGRVKVLDFGLAKMPAARGPGDEEAATNLATEAGSVLGTPAYMSPEQVSGLDVDHRTDVFSLGVLIYEMATGVRPFRGRSSAELASSILRDVPRPVLDVRSTVPSDLARVIARCLEKDVSARFRSMADVSKALRPAPPDQAAQGPSVAVLPFQNLSADPENEFFGDGLAEEILNALTQIDGLRVAARTSSFSFKGKATDIGEIGAKLHVATVLEGSVRRAGPRVRVTVQLVDVTNGFQLWSERYDRQMADIFDVQDEIARGIADKLKITLAGSTSTRLVKAVTSNVQAYELYLRGRALLLKRGKGASEGADCLRRATELDPGFAAAWAGLADAHTVKGFWGMAPPAETMPKALTAARRAVELDPDLAEGHAALAAALLLWERDYAAADASFRRCLALNPGYTVGRCWYALFSLQFVHGRLDDGVAEARRALEADPLSAYATSLLAMTLGVAGHTAEAVEMGRLAVQRDPDALLAHWVHGLTAHWHGAFEESVAAFAAATAVSGSAYATVCCAATYADWGRPAEARAEYDKACVQSLREYVPRTSLALAAAAAGEQDLAIDLARQSCDEREPALFIYARVFPDWRRIREDPRFDDVMRRLALP